MAHFEMLYFEQDRADPEVIVAMLKKFMNVITPEENVYLLRCIEYVEIVNVVWGMALDKTSSPNDFSIHFYRSHWSIIKTNLKRIVD
jgi:hypothetical protein